VSRNDDGVAANREWNPSAGAVVNADVAKFGSSGDARETTP